MPVTVTFIPELADHVRASAIALLAKKSILYLFIGMFIVVPWLFAILILTMSASAGQSVNWQMIAVLSTSPIFAVLGFAGLIWIQAKSIMSSSPATQGEHCYKFGLEQIFITAPGLNNQVDLKNITKYKDSKFGILMFSGSVPILFVPERGFESAQDRIALIQHLNHL